MTIETDAIIEVSLNNLVSYFMEFKNKLENGEIETNSEIKEYVEMRFR